MAENRLAFLRASTINLVNQTSRWKFVGAELADWRRPKSCRQAMSSTNLSVSSSNHFPSYLTLSIDVLLMWFLEQTGGCVDVNQGQPHSLLMLMTS